MTTALADLRVDRARLLGRLDALGQIGDTGDGGVCRLALTDADQAGRDLVVSWMDDLGLRVDIDGVGNVVGTWPADRYDAPVMIGSHIDTVATGGRYDGNLGVLAGLEVLETIIGQSVATHRPVAIAFFTDEEGSRFAPDMLGSVVFAGDLPLEVALDTVGIDGSVLGAELERIGYVGTTPVPVGATPRLRRAPHRAGPDPRGRARRHRCRHRRAGHLVARAGVVRPVQPRRHDAHAPAPRRRVRRRPDRRARP